MNILLTGGAGYIGSHVLKLLIYNHKVTVVDNLSTGFIQTINTLKHFGNIDFINEDFGNFKQMDIIFKKGDFDIVIHFAGSLIVSESIDKPLEYYKNNTSNSLNLITLCNKYNVHKFIFSSTAAVYGNPIDNNNFDENSRTNPINPYGKSKLFVENIIKDYAVSNSNFKYVILRYFNVAGANESLKIGECHNPETHLIPLVVKTALGKRDKIYIFGNDYNTFDGTCIRDYIHVDDLVSAHLAAIDYLDLNGSNIFNCGYGRGFSVKEVINTVKLISKKDFRIEISKRREGDPDILVSNNSKLLKLTNWKPKYNDLTYICKSAFEWEKKLE